ncbi:MAG: GNAT family N-acetyltransferase [Pseudomonadota bacterium]
MPTIIRDVTAEDLERISEINRGAMPDVNDIPPERLAAFLRHSDYFRVATRDGEIAAFLIALLPGHEYESENYRWFLGHALNFVYIDRVVVDSAFRGLGIANVLYADVQSFAEQRAPVLTCEVYLSPRNDVSMLFHGAQGFHEVGRQRLPDGRHVSLLSKPLPSFDYVERQYGSPTLESVDG